MSQATARKFLPKTSIWPRQARAAPPIYPGAHIGEQFIEMFEVIRRDAEAAIDAGGGPLDPLEVQHHLDACVHFVSRRLSCQLAVAIADQPIGSHLGAQYRAEAGI